MYILIVGAGDTGIPLIEMATTRGNEVAVIEDNAERAEQVSNQFDCLIINDDATSKEVLQDAGAGRADVLISTTNQDETNIMVCLLAQELNIPHIVSVVNDTEHIRLYRQIGVDTMENPQHLIAEYLYRTVKYPSVSDFMHIGDRADVFEITVSSNAPITGKTLEEAASEDLISNDMLIVAIERDHQSDRITPRGTTRIEAGDLVTVYSGKGMTPDIINIFDHTEDHD